MSYQLCIFDEAQEDAEQIADYIGQRSVEGMYRWLDA